MQLTIRPYQPGDLSELRALHGVSQWSPTVDRAAVQQGDELGADTLQRVVAVDEGRLVGYGYVARSAWHPSGWFQSEVLVVPGMRRQGAGAALTQQCLALAQELGATSLTTWTNGRMPEFEAFASRRGFHAVQRFVTMTLQVSEADDALLARLVARASGEGVRLFSFAETGNTPEARRRLYELNRRLAPLLPGNGDEFPTFSEYEREILDAEWFRAEGQLIAATADRWIGLVGLGFYEDGQALQHEFTAVDPAMQGRGVAQALKSWSVQKAKEWGVRVVRTGNDASNAPIIAVNRRLGYDLAPGVVKLRRLVGRGS